MPNLPSYNPDVAGHKPTTRKGQRQQNVDLQSFLALSGQRQPLMENPAFSNPGNNSVDLRPGYERPFTPQYVTDQAASPTSAPGYFSQGSDVAASLLARAGQQSTEYHRGDVQDARQQLLEALTLPGGKGNPDLVKDGYTGRGLLYDVMSVRNGKAVSDADQALNDALRAQRQRAIGNTQANTGAGNIKQRTHEMTDAEYNALPPLQKAAIDYNTLLVDAVRKDRHSQDDYNPSPDERNKYNQAVEDMFGEDRGTEGQYAPETVALLKQLGIADKAGDLDDYLSLNASIKAKDLKDLRPEDLAPSTTATSAENQELNPAHPLLEDRQALDRVLAHSTKRMEMQLARGAQIVASMNDTVQYELSNRIESYGGTANEQKKGLGWDDLGTYNPLAEAQTPSQYFIQAFDTLATAKYAKSKDAIMGAVQAKLTDSEYSAFLDYLDQRSMDAQRFKQPLGMVQGAEYLNPKQFREMLGLDSGGPAPAQQAPAAPPAVQGGGY